MKKTKNLDVFLMYFWILALLMTFFVSDFCYARLNWKSIGPEGRYIHGIAIDPGNSSIIYAGTSYGVFMSADEGGTRSGAGMTV